ncbi:MAG: hypothetical protein ACYCVZ_12185 [Streptosporangiaceae bacterium]
MTPAERARRQPGDDPRHCPRGWASGTGTAALDVQWPPAPGAAALRQALTTLRQVRAMTACERVGRGHSRGDHRDPGSPRALVQGPLSGLPGEDDLVVVGPLRPEMADGDVGRAASA